MEDINMNFNNNSFKKISEKDLSDIHGGNLGEVLKFYREKANISAKELAELLYVSSTTLSHYENNRRRPSLEFIRDFSILLQVDIQKLFKDL